MRGFPSARPYSSIWTVLAFVGAVAIYPTAVSAGSESPPVSAAARGVEQAPAGYDKYLIYIADGVYAPSEPYPDSRITGCGPSPFCDGDYFHKEIMGRDDYEIQTLEAEAKEYFRVQFGVDVDDPANAGRLVFRSFMLDPRLNYHVISASGEQVPSEGWRVRDGGWATIFVDPDGFDLGGNSSGQHVPPGTMVVFGDYNIQNVKRHKDEEGGGNSKRGPIVIRYRSIEPQLPTDRSFQCEVLHDEYGSGLVRGRVEVMMNGNERIRINAVSVITFPGFSKLFE